MIILLPAILIISAIIGMLMKLREMKKEKNTNTMEERYEEYYWLAKSGQWSNNFRLLVLLLLGFASFIFLILYFLNIIK
jgi:hypothetical protein